MVYKLTSCRISKLNQLCFAALYELFCYNVGMNELLFGTAGIPLSTVTTGKGDLATALGIRKVAQLGLGTMELEFVNKIYLTERTALEVAKVQKETQLPLSAHAPYYINLNADDERKLNLSRAYIYNSAKSLYACGGTDVVFHGGYYLGMDAETTYKKIREQLFSIEKKLEAESIKIRLRPEISGKTSAFGSVEEIINLSVDLKTVWPCIDFSHAYARSVGQFNSYNDFCSILQLMKDRLGEESVTEKLHAHVSGIIYTAKGEKEHLTFAESSFNMPDLMRALNAFSAGGRIICESNNLETDALLLKHTYEQSN